MRIYLDSNILIYLIEGEPEWRTRVNLRLEALLDSEAVFAVSDLTRMECRVHPIRRGDYALLEQYEELFGFPEVNVLPLTRAVFDRAAEIRARDRLSTPDALHLAAVVEGECDSFLSNDTRLASFAELAVEALD